VELRNFCHINKERKRKKIKAEKEEARVEFLRILMMERYNV
jgi:hypothetical protein